MKQETHTQGTNPLAYYFLFTGQVIAFDSKDPEQNINGVLLNAMIVHDSPNIPVRIIGKAQQALQLNFFQKTGNPDFTIVDVVIMNITNLGHMTQEEFHQAPEGMEIQEIDISEDRTVN